MPKNKEVFFYKEDTSKITRFIDTTGNNFLEVFVAGSEDSHLFILNITSTDTAAKFIDFYESESGNVNNVLTNGVPVKSGVAINIGQGTGTDFPDPIRLMQANGNFIVGRLLDRDQNFYYPVKAGFSIYARIRGTAVTTGRVLSVLAKGKDF